MYAVQTWPDWETRRAQVWAWVASSLVRSMFHPKASMVLMLSLMDHLYESFSCTAQKYNTDIKQSQETMRQNWQLNSDKKE